MKKLIAASVLFLLLLVGCDAQQTQSGSSSNKDNSTAEPTMVESLTAYSTEVPPFLIKPLEIKGAESVPVTYDETLIQYPEYPEGTIPRDYDYTVRIIQGENAIELPVYNPVYASDYFTNTVYNFDQHRRYAEFAFTGEPVTVEITVNLEFDRYTIMPSSKEIPSEINGNVITYTITEPCTTVLKLNNDKDTHLTIFAEATETERPNTEAEKIIYFEPGYHDQGGVIKTYSGTTLYFEAGYHEFESGALNVSNDTTVYLEPGAIVKARLDINGMNVRVYGRGAFIEPSPTRQAVSGTSYMCMLNGSYNVSIEDVRFLDAHTYNIVISGGVNIRCEGVKLLCNQVSTDGLSIWGGGVYGLKMENCYFNISDNVFVVGGGIQNFFVNNAIIITDYAVFFPQGKSTGDPLIFTNIDVLRYKTFVTHHYPNKVGEKSLYFVLENCTAIDSDRVGDFIISRYGGSAEKNYVLKNVSVSPIYDNWSYYISTTEGDYKGEDVENVTILFDNVWVGSNPITKKLISKKDTLNYKKNNTVIYTDTKDESLVTTKRNDVILSEKVTPYQIYIGDRRIETKYQPYEKDGKVYVSAYEILEAMLFEDIKVENSKLTFAYANNSYEIAVADEKAMVDIDTLSKTIGTQINLSGNRIKVTNIKRNDNLLRDPDFELGLSMNWVTRNFTKFYLSEDAQSGKYSIRMGDYTWGATGGIYQDIADILRQHGTGQYRVTAWVKNAEAGTEDNYVLLFLADGWESVPASKRFDVTDQWQKVEFVFTQDNIYKMNGMMLCIGQNGGNKNILVDNVSMTKLD